MTALVILGIVFSVLLFWGVPVSFCIGIATLLALSAMANVGKAIASTLAGASRSSGAALRSGRSMKW